MFVQIHKIWQMPSAEEEPKGKSHKNDFAPSCHLQCTVFVFKSYKCFVFSVLSPPHPVALSSWHSPRPVVLDETQVHRSRSCVHACSVSARGWGLTCWASREVTRCFLTHWKFQGALFYSDSMKTLEGVWTKQQRWEEAAVDIICPHLPCVCLKLFLFIWR